MPNKITVNFEPCAGATGYFFKYRVKGSTEPYRDGAVIRDSPAMAYVTADPDGTLYEGYIQSFCIQFPSGGTIPGKPVYFETTAAQQSQIQQAEVFVGGVGTVCFGDALEVIYYRGTFGNGTIIYSDSAAQTFFNHYSHIAKDGIKYSVNSSNGVITALGAC